MDTAGVERLNGLPEDELRAELQRCFAHDGWALTVAAHRPFADAAALFEAAATAWQALTDDDWAAALAALPEPAVPEGEDAARTAVQVALDLYRARFGYPFSAATAVTTPDEMLMLIRIRLGHEPAAELRRSRDESRQRARLRLERLAQQRSP